MSLAQSTAPAAAAAMGQPSTDHLGRCGAHPAMTKRRQDPKCGWLLAVERLEEADMEYIMNFGTLG
jgi:hypothetical protein